MFALLVLASQCITVGGLCVSLWCPNRTAGYLLGPLVTLWDYVTLWYRNLTGIGYLLGKH